MTIASNAFRKVMSRFAAGVTVVTVLDEARTPIGFTVTAFSSLSLDPPLVLICGTTGRYAHSVLSQAPAFAVNFLAADQQHIAQRFADPRIRDRFSGVPTRPGPYGLPLLEGSLAGVVCERHSQFEAGDHTVFVGQVCQLWDADRAPLLHYSGNFNRIAQGSELAAAGRQTTSDFLVGHPW
jgi:flavin reductase (DIM6/NTAB) family NADH-FMN oxidoreductase RutF